jgi:hypothetical protein
MAIISPVPHVHHIHQPISLVNDCERRMHGATLCVVSAIANGLLLLLSTPKLIPHSLDFESICGCVCGIIGATFIEECQCTTATGWTGPAGGPCIGPDGNAHLITHVSYMSWSCRHTLCCVLRVLV